MQIETNWWCWTYRRGDVLLIGDILASLVAPLDADGWFRVMAIEPKTHGVKQVEVQGVVRTDLQFRWRLHTAKGSERDDVGCHFIYRQSQETPNERATRATFPPTPKGKNQVA